MRVPTWDYASVVVKGHAKIVLDSSEKIDFLGKLVKANEAPRVQLDTSSPEWSVEYLSNERLHKMTGQISKIKS